MTDSSKAVFLSYASQDAEAARRICAALRAADIEVWFDQSELRGGDVWDQKIRRQIKDCALFVPVISRHTHERDEGYFRFEWKLAVDRSHLMSKTRPFLIHVVIDDSPNDDQVPDRFGEIQWTKLVDGETPTAFVEGILKLLSPETREGTRAGEIAEQHAPNLRSLSAEHGTRLNVIEQQIRFTRAPDGTRIAFAKTGDGYPLVNAAHWLGHLEFDLQTPVWLPWIERLSARYSLTRYDSRGCGLSDRDVSDYVLEKLVSDLEAVVDAAGLDRFALFAKSQGGPISVAYAASHPERVSHLVMCGAFARGALVGDPAPQRRAAIEALTQLIEVGWGESNSAFRQVFTSLLFPGATPEQMQSFNRIQREATSPAHAARILRALVVLDASSYLGRIMCPTLVMHCRGDALIPLEEGRYLAASISGARFESLDSQNHVPLAGEPAFERVFDLLRDFLSDEPP